MHGHLLPDNSLADNQFDTSIILFNYLRSNLALLSVLQLPLQQAKSIMFQCALLCVNSILANKFIERTVKF